MQPPVIMTEDMKKKEKADAKMVEAKKSTESLVSSMLGNLAGYAGVAIS